MGEHSDCPTVTPCFFVLCFDVLVFLPRLTRVLRTLTLNFECRLPCRSNYGSASNAVRAVNGPVARVVTQDRIRVRRQCGNETSSRIRCPLRDCNGHRDHAASNVQRGLNSGRPNGESPKRRGTNAVCRSARRNGHARNFVSGDRNCTRNSYYRASKAGSGR